MATRTLSTVSLIPLHDMPLVQPGDDLASLILQAVHADGLELEPHDIVVVTQKIVSKSEGRLISLSGIAPDENARHIGEEVDLDPRLVAVVLAESREVLWVSRGLLIVETHQGLVCAKAGVDRCNVGPTSDSEVACLLPLDSDASAGRLRDRLRDLAGLEVAVVINDSQGRPFRRGAVGVAVGLAGICPVISQEGRQDLFGRPRRSTRTAIADEIAAAASLVMGQMDEGVPVVIVRGLAERDEALFAEGQASGLIRPAGEDVFRMPF